jgi:uncharacterized protein YfaP (DUF2135 family)
MKNVVEGEYLSMIRTALRSKQIASVQKDFLEKRLKKLSNGHSATTGDIMVTITWNTDNTDVDLHIVEPSGEECYYQNKKTQSGGWLLEDITQGYGPERYLMKNAAQGKYVVSVRYYAGDSRKMSDKTFVEATITLEVGTPKERSWSYYTMLTSSKEKILITSFQWPSE